MELHADAPDTLRLVIIGGGEGGVRLLRELVQHPFIDVIALVDRNPEAPGAIAAALNGIPVHASLAVCVESAPLCADDVDMLLDLTGDPAVYVEATRLAATWLPKPVAVVPTIVSRMIVSIIERQDTLIGAAS